MVKIHLISIFQLFRVQQNASLPKSVQKAIGIDLKKSNSKRRSRNRSSPSNKSCSPGGFFSSLTSRTSLKDFCGSKHTDFSSSGTSNSGSKVFARDAGSTPCRSRQSSRRSGKENKFGKRKSSSNFGASLDLKEEQSVTPVTSSKKLPARVCQLVNENLFCISGMSALTINTPPSAYRKMAFGHHSMVTRSMTKNKESTEIQEHDALSEENEAVDKRSNGETNAGFGMSVYEASPKVRVRKRLSLLDSSMTSSKTGNTEATETDFPYEGDSILARGPSARFSRRNSLRESQGSLGKDMPMANTMNATWSSLQSILEDTEITTQNAPKGGRGSMRNRSVVSAIAAPVSYFITPSSKLRKSAKHRNASSTATCTRHDKKCVTPEQKPPLKATVKRSKSVTFSNKKEVTISRLSTSEKRQKQLSLRRKPVVVSGESARVEMREDAGHTPKPSRKKQEPVDERLI